MTAMAGWLEVVLTPLRWPPRARVFGISSKWSNGQGMIEFTTLIAVIVAALIAMQIYMKRGVQGRLRSAVDSISEPYDPKNTNSDTTLMTNSQSKSETTLDRDRLIPVGNANVKADVLVSKTTIEQEKTERSGSETVGALGNDLWR